MFKPNLLKKITEQVDVPEMAIGKDEPLMTLNGVVKTYGDGFTALKGLSADFYMGEFVGVMGKSGAGKTTLVNMVTGLDHLTAGDVNIGGISIKDLNENQIAVWRGRNVGIVFQTNRLMPTLSLLDNVMLPIDLCGDYNRSQSRELAMELLRRVELEEHAFKLPSAISGGQQQRVAIARALANDPAIIVADEPTGRLDSVTSEVIYQIFRDLAARGKLIIMVSHDISIVNRLTRRIDLVDGVIAHDSGADSAQNSGVDLAQNDLAASAQDEDITEEAK